MSKITTVIFDFDGTMMDTNEVVMESWQHTYRTLWGREEDPDVIMKDFGEPLRTTMARVFPDVDLDEALNVYRSYQKGFYKKLIHLFPGVRELMGELQEKGYKLGIVTSRTRQSTLDGLDAVSVPVETFAYITAADDTDKHKPDPEPALIALQKMSSLPEESIMVGDSRFDTGCGNNAGMYTVLVNWSAAAKVQEHTAEFQPDFRIDHPEELWDVIQKIEEEQ